MEGKPDQQGNVISRYIYVLDKRSSAANPALVNVYLRTDTISANSDAINVSLQQQIQPGFPGAPDANCFMAGSNSLIIAGTDASAVAGKIDSATLKVSTIQGERNVQSITADERGYITVSYLNDESYTVNPKGEFEQDGGGTYKMANTRNAFTTNANGAPHRTK